MSGDEAEEFAGVVRLKLVEDDYGILRKYEGRSSLATYMTVVVQRMLLDYRIHFLGKWHPSAESRRRGEVAVELEKLLHRDGRTLEDAVALLGPRFGASRESLSQIADGLPPRGPKRTMVDIEEASSVATPPSPTPDRHDVSQHVSSLVRQFIEGLPSDDRLTLQLRFDAEMQVSQIARSLGLEQKALYRSIEKRLRELRTHLEQHGVSSEEAAELIGDRGVVLDFRLRAPDQEDREEASR